MEEVNSLEEVVGSVVCKVAVDHLETFDPVPIAHSVRFKQKLMQALAETVVVGHIANTQCREEKNSMTGFSIFALLMYILEITTCFRKYKLRGSPSIFIIPLPQETRMNFLAQVLNPLWDYIEEKSSSSAMIELRLDQADKIHKEAVKERKKRSEELRKAELALSAHKIKHKESLDEEINRLSSQLADVRQKNGILTSENEQLTTINKKLHNEREQLQKEVSELETMKKELQEKIEEGQKRLGDFKSTGSWTSENIQLTTINGILRNEISKLEATNKELQDKNEEDQQRLSVLSKNAMNLEESLEKLQQVMAGKQREPLEFAVHSSHAPTTNFYAPLPRRQSRDIPAPPPTPGLSSCGSLPKPPVPSPKFLPQLSLLGANLGPPQLHPVGVDQVGPGLGPAPKMDDAQVYTLLRVPWPGLQRASTDSYLTIGPLAQPPRLGPASYAAALPPPGQPQPPCVLPPPGVVNPQPNVPPPRQNQQPSAANVLPPPPAFPRPVLQPLGGNIPPPQCPANVVSPLQPIAMPQPYVYKPQVQVQSVPRPFQVQAVACQPLQGGVTTGGAADLMPPVYVCKTPKPRQPQGGMVVQMSPPPTAGLVPNKPPVVVNTAATSSPSSTGASTSTSPLNDHFLNASMAPQHHTLLTENNELFQPDGKVKGGHVGKPMFPKNPKPGGLPKVWLDVSTGHTEVCCSSSQQMAKENNQDIPEILSSWREFGVDNGLWNQAKDLIIPS
ncbi:hypothetical protein Pelo_1616 [Pelomyxa schiedti]|nr:hypothetical protein Pelo_1616 [Pelomyxa schiedti]